MNDALLRLALDAGIEREYWDGLGIRRELSQFTAEALLDALGYDAHADCEAQIAARAQARFLAPLPPVIVIRSGGRPVVDVAVMQSHRHQDIPWEVVLESGERIHGTFAFSAAEVIEEREIAATRYLRLRMALASPLPEGYHRLRIPALDAGTELIVAPARCHLPEAGNRGARCWGIAIQLYTLRSARNWGVGDLSDLARLAEQAGRAGAAFVGLNPLHARHAVRPDDASPYAPSSRLFLDAIYVDVEAIDEFAHCAEANVLVNTPEFQQRLAEAREVRLVDYATVTGLKLQVLRILYDAFRRTSIGAAHGRGLQFRHFCDEGGEPLEHYARFEALRLRLKQQSGSCPGWFDWPREYGQRESDADASMRDTTTEQVEFQMYVQWIASLQLQSAAQAAHDAGMAIGLYRDLAVGAAHDSAETWSDPSLFALRMDVGAPPDVLNRQGQCWGLAPWNPRRLEQQAFLPWRRLLAANMQNAGALRIDHVMALTRLFWIPQGMTGADGGYVRQPLEEMAAIVALESARHRCVVIGEDLGSVPEGLRARLHEYGVLSYRVLVYERHWQDDGRFCMPEEYPERALATVATHDMPTMTEYWTGDDIRRRDQLGMYPSEEHRHQETTRRGHERNGMLELMARSDLSPHRADDPAAAIEGLHQVIARSRSMLAAIQLDDLAGESEPVNIPGTHHEYPNWRRKLSISLEELPSDTRWLGLVEAMRAAGRS